jgi:hypothetical protein
MVINRTLKSTRLRLYGIVLGYKASTLRYQLLVHQLTYVVSMLLCYNQDTSDFIFEQIC